MLTFLGLARRGSLECTGCGSCTQVLNDGVIHLNPYLDSKFQIAHVSFKSMVGTDEIKRYISWKSEVNTLFNYFLMKIAMIMG